MIKEIVQFIDGLDPEFKALGLKTKEGLHIILRIQREEERVFIDERSLVQWAYTKNKKLEPDDISLLKRCSELSRISWCVNTNKCFDLPVKAIHSCSPYCVAIKRENLTGGEKFNINRREGKSQVYDRIVSYFSKAALLADSEEERQQIKIFEDALNSEEKFNQWLSLIPDYPDVKDADYVIFYLDVPVEKYETANAKYLADKLFNTNDYNLNVGNDTFGTSDFFNGYPTKKPFLTHQTATFDIAGRVSAKEAKSLYEFQDIMGRNILPKPLPIFIHQDEIKPKRGSSIRDSAIKLFKREASRENRIGCREIFEELYEIHGDELENYYLLFFDRGEIKDFDFVPKFEYELRDREGKKWEIADLFEGGNGQSIKNVFHLQETVLLPVFNNRLVVKTKTGSLQYKYFDEIDAKFSKSALNYLHVLHYRKAFYDFIYKSKRQSITPQTFHKILQETILEDIRLDEIKNGYHTEDRTIRQKLNIWFSITENFDPNYIKNNKSMGNKLLANREFIQKLTKGDANISSDEEYAFTVGQVIYYLLSKSKTADRSYKRLEPFMQQAQSKELNKAIARLFDSYKHEKFSANFRTPFSEVLGYETNTNIRELIPAILSGVFSKNALFSDQEYKEQAEVVQEEELD